MGRDQRAELELPLAMGSIRRGHVDYLPVEHLVAGAWLDEVVVDVGQVGTGASAGGVRGHGQGYLRGTARSRVRTRDDENTRGSRASTGPQQTSRDHTRRCPEIGRISDTRPSFGRTPDKAGCALE